LIEVEQNEVRDSERIKDPNFLTKGGQCSDPLPTFHNLGRVGIKGDDYLSVARRCLLHHLFYESLMATMHSVKVSKGSDRCVVGLLRKT
jgi:hypothetical protein